MPSIEVQIIEGGVGDFIAVGGPDKYGKRVPLTLPAPWRLIKDRATVIWKPDGNRRDISTRPH